MREDRPVQFSPGMCVMVRQQRVVFFYSIGRTTKVPLCIRFRWNVGAEVFSPVPMGVYSSRSSKTIALISPLCYSFKFQEHVRGL